MLFLSLVLNAVAVILHYHIALKGKLGKKIYRLKVFISLKLKQITKGNFHRKAPKWAKNQVKGSRIH